MIQINNIKKTFNDQLVLDNINIQIENKKIFLLAGTNGAGKSTLLRLIASIYKADSGSISIDNENNFENENIKKEMMFISDDEYFFANSTIKEMKDYFKIYYSNFDNELYIKMLNDFNLDENKQISKLSKGMKRQISIILGLCVNVKYLLIDEAFDGLDPLTRQKMKGYIAENIENRDLTIIAATHALRELEDMCDSIGILNEGKLILSNDYENIKANIHKVQLILSDEKEDKFDDLDISTIEHKGRLIIMVVRGSEEEIKQKLNKRNNMYLEVLPLSFEEIFINEMKGANNIYE
ncbi:MAG: ABC transporter ATP-binding protein [Eubacteriales bacterium]|nr:ABC transporter ATP-binding protein [Eubacteriales bacterium]